MSYLSDAGVTDITPPPLAPTPSGSSYLSDAFSAPQSPAVQARTANVQATTGAAQVAAANAKNNTGFGNVALNTVKGLWPASGIPQQFEQGVQQYQQNAPKWMGGTATGKQGVIGAGESALGVGSGIATAAFAPLAPVFNPLGKAINAVGNAMANTKSPAQNAMLAKFANSPAGMVTARVAGDVANAANIAGAVVGGAAGIHEAFKPNVEGGYLEHAQAAPEEGTFTEKPLAQTHAEYAQSQGYKSTETPAEETTKSPATPRAGEPVKTVAEAAPSPKPEKPIAQIPRGGHYEVAYGDQGTTRAFKEFTSLKQAQSFVDSQVKAGGKTVFLDAYDTEGDLMDSKDFSVKEPGTTEPGYKPLTPAESTGEVKQSTLASKVDANAVANKLTDTLGDLPEYNKVDMKEQAQFATDLIANEPDKAMNIAMGKEAPPAHILPEAVFTALEDKATKEGDVDTLSKLATESNLSTQATAMGQRIKMLSARDDLSPVKSIQEVAKSRAGRSTPRLVKPIVEAGRAAIRQAPKLDAVADFIKSIECGINIWDSAYQKNCQHLSSKLLKAAS